MRILHLLPGLMTGGQETMVINIANVQSVNHDVYVMIINNDYQPDLVSLFDEKVRLLYVNRPRSSKNPFYLAKLNWMIYKCCPDVVHSHYEKQVRYIIRMGYKFVYTIHNTTINAADLQRNHNAVAISNAVKNDVERRTNLKPVVICNGILVDKIKQRKSAPYYSPNKQFRIVQISRLSINHKGQDILVKALSVLRSRGYNNLSLDLIGDGASRDCIEQLIDELQVKDCVRLLGRKPVEFVNNHLCDYDLFVQPSRYEGFGLTVAEAMAAKVPVVVSNIEGPMEIVDNGRFGLTFENGSIKDCAEKIEQILNTNCAEIKRIIDSAWLYVDTKFNVNTTAANYIRFYSSCE